ncbi:hypothetical protein [Streptomyces sp. GSL17-111]|uniref:hypothetical protein n=1 Tax=Streptomyces sp. GSL17-111 TaxID=3121596 RepID=UPI0030F3EBB6
MSESDWRRRVRQARVDDAERLLEELGTDDREDAEIEADHRVSHLEALREWAPDATLPEELQLRLTGPDTGTGALRFQWGEALLGDVEKVVSEAAGAPVALEITGISRGSTVVHARAVETSRPPTPDTLTTVGASTADHGVRALTRLLGALEEGGDVREWSKMFDSVEGLAKALDRFGLSLGVTWYAANGDVRRAALTERGVTHAKNLQRTYDADQEMVVSGRVTELRSSGLVKVKSGTAHNAHAYDVRVEPEQLISMRLSLGDHVHFRVLFRRKLDVLGRTRASEYHYRGTEAEDLRFDVHP